MKYKAKNIRSRYSNKKKSQKNNIPTIFKIKLYSIQQLITSIALILLLILFLNLPILNSRQVSPNIKEYISKDIEFDKLYNFFNNYMDKLQKQG